MPRLRTLRFCRLSGRMIGPQLTGQGLSFTYNVCSDGRQMTAAAAQYDKGAASCVRLLRCLDAYQQVSYEGVHATTGAAKPAACHSLQPSALGVKHMRPALTYWQLCLVQVCSTTVRCRVVAGCDLKFEAVERATRPRRRIQQCHTIRRVVERAIALAVGEPVHGRHQLPIAMSVRACVLLLLPCTMLPCRAAAATHPLVELVTAASAVAGESAEQPCNQASATSTSTALRHVPARPRAPRMQARMTGRLRVERGIVFRCCDFGRMSMDLSAARLVRAAHAQCKSAVVAPIQVNSMLLCAGLRLSE